MIYCNMYHHCIIVNSILFYILTSNENATPKCTSYLKDILNILSQRISGDFMNTKDKDRIGFITFNVKCQNFLYACLLFNRSLSGIHLQA